MKLKNLFVISRQKVILWLTFVITMIIAPTHPVRAQFGIEILTAPFVFLAHLGTMLLIAMPISFLALEMGQIFLSWTSNPALVGSITHNQFVLLGWATVRDFANLFFILIIVAIGIATALRIKQYEVKKTLPRLVIVAILINFSPVICGVIIDAANIIMNFFFTAGAGGFSKGISLAKGSWEFLKSAFQSAAGNWTEIFTGVLFFKMIFVMIFNFFGTFVLFLMGMLFLMRDLALWLLVILSPFAFLSAILPSTQKLFFNKWRDQFTKWTFVGVTGAFFIYLSQLMLQVGVETVLNNQKPATGVSAGGGNIVTNLMIMAVPFMFLLIGYFATVSSSAMGAGAVVGLAKKGGKWAYGKTGAKTVESLRQSARETVETSIKRPAREIGNRIATKISTPEERQEAYSEAKGLKKLGKGVSRVLIPYKRREAIKSHWEAKKGETEITKVEESKTIADKLKTSQSRRAKFDRDVEEHNYEAQVGDIQSVIKNHELDKYSEQEIKNTMRYAGRIDKKLAEKVMVNAPKKAEELADDYQKEIGVAKRDGKNKKARRLLKEAEDMGLILDEKDKEKGYGTLSDKLADKIKKEDIPNLDPDDLKDQEYMASMMKFWDPSKFATAGRELGRRALEEIQKGMDTVGGKKLETEYKSLGKFADSTAAGDLGIRKPEKDSDPNKENYQKFVAAINKGLHRQEVFVELKKIIKIEKGSKDESSESDDDYIILDREPSSDERGDGGDEQENNEREPRQDER
ncbi:MAG: hypothetical protein NTY11_02270 [Candidatus Parcubacteria bacterium]|nr:hypothetical protein [Candidatus Parcubacteria bacterium]